jgi:hypothetical protein
VKFETSSNAEQVSAGLNAMADRLAEPAPSLERARRLIALGESDVWASEGAAIGTHWPMAVDPDLKTDARLLVATGALRDSLAGGAAGYVRGNELVISTDVPYAHFHEYGTSKMAARPFIGIPEAMRATITRILFEDV